jgi:SAM-dependent methyltransferase
MTVARTRTEKLIGLLSRNAAFDKVIQSLQRNSYRLFTRLLIRDDVVFLNFGYEEDPPMGVPLAASDEPNRLPIQLYHRTGTQVDLTGKKVLEVSSGLGGGASYLTRTQHPASYTGLDLNTVAIQFCRKRHNVPGLDFVHGNAQSLPFADQSFDVVINVEASLHYPDLAGFLTEVKRVLRPGGHFLYTDIRDADQIPEWEATLADAPMRLLSQQDISADVIRGLQKNPLLDQIPRRVPNIPFLRNIANDLIGRAGSLIRRRLENGEASYRLYCFAKDEAA